MVADAYVFIIIIMYYTKDEQLAVIYSAGVLLTSDDILDYSEEIFFKKKVLPMVGADVSILSFMAKKDMSFMERIHEIIKNMSHEKKLEVRNLWADIIRLDGKIDVEELETYKMMCFLCGIDPDYNSLYL